MITHLLTENLSASLYLLSIRPHLDLSVPVTLPDVSNFSFYECLTSGGNSVLSSFIRFSLPQVYTLLQILPTNMSLILKSAPSSYRLITTGPLLGP